MSREWKPGTVAVATVRGVPNVRVFRVRKAWVYLPVGNEDRSYPCTYTAIYDNAAEVTDVRPLVVLDMLAANDCLRDGEAAQQAIKTLRASDYISDTGLANQIEAQTRPPKPEVFEHLVYRVDGHAAVAVCGKVWAHDSDAIVVGRCPECTAVAESGWTA